MTNTNVVAIGAPVFSKLDMTTDARKIHPFGDMRHPGEFVFVPAHSQAGEARPG